MFCGKCGSKMVDGALFCSSCGAKTEANSGAASIKAPAVSGAILKKLVAVGVVVVLVIVLVLALKSCTFEGGSVSGSGLSGKYGEYSDYYDCWYYTIDFNRDGTCVVTIRDYERYSCTYYRNDDGTYIIDFHDMVYGAWLAEKDGDELFIQGTALGKGSTFERID